VTIFVWNFCLERSLTNAPGAKGWLSGLDQGTDYRPISLNHPPINRGLPLTFSWSSPIVRGER
jgi:hypothetical protein